MLASSIQEPLFEILQPDRLTAVVDIGANPIDGEPPYKKMLNKGLCTLIGFEPIPEALAELNTKKGPLEKYFGTAVGDGATHTLNVCEATGMSSLLTPDAKVCNLFRGFSDWSRITQKIELQTQRLDDLDVAPDVDFLKVDVQGTELDVIRCGRSKLARAVAVQAEISFVCLYEKQPSFGEIDIELRSLGFVPHTFTAIKRWMIRPVESPDPAAALNQLLEADIVYVRYFTRPELMSDEQLKHLAMIAHHCYGSADLAANCIHQLVQRGRLPEDRVSHYLSLVQRRAI